MSFAWQWERERKKHFWIFDYIFALYSCGCVSKWCDKREIFLAFFNLTSTPNFTIRHQRTHLLMMKEKPSKPISDSRKCHEIKEYGWRRESAQIEMLLKKNVREPCSSFHFNCLKILINFSMFINTSCSWFLISSLWHLMRTLRCLTVMIISKFYARDRNDNEIFANIINLCAHIPAWNSNYYFSRVPLD